MRSLVFFLTWILLMTPAFSQSIVTTDPDGDGPLPARERIAGRIVIDLREQLSTTELATWGHIYGIHPEFVSQEHGLAIAQVGESRLSSLLSQLSSDPLVESIAPEYIVASTSLGSVQGQSESEPSRGFPNDPRFGDQWHLSMVGATKAWKKADGEGIKVAVIDSGVAYTAKDRVKPVEDLAQTDVEEGYDFVNGDELAVDDLGTGTHMAGTVAQSTHNGIGVAGLAYKSTIIPIKVLNEKGSGTFSNCAAGIRLAADRGAHIIVMGFGSKADHELMEQACIYARKKGCLLIAPAGCDADVHPGYPAAYEQVLAVGAVARNKRHAQYSSRGVDVVAPGGYSDVAHGILQNTIHRHNPGKSDYLWQAGTNCAAASVAGVAALVMSKGVTDADTVAEILLSTATKQRDKKRYGAGIINADKAVRKAQAKAESGCPLAWFFVLGVLGWLFRRSKAQV